MIADAELATHQVAGIDEELGVQRVDRTVTQFRRVEALEAVDDGLVESEALADRLLRLHGQARVAHAGAGRVAGQDTKEEEIEHDHEENREERPGAFAEQIG